MHKWVSVKVGTPGNEIPCILLRRDMGITSVYQKFAEWDGNEWIDIDGSVVTGVKAWTKAPTYDSRLEELISKIAGCMENDKCEEKDCCYFVAPNLFEELLEYINE